MNQLINGLHHVTALAGSPQRNVDFYVGVLGLRLIKKTINFDAPDVYHLYYGDEVGQPGTIMTFFPFGGNIRRGRRGTGQLTYTSFTIPEASLSYWLDRLKAHDVPYAGPYQRFGESYIRFEDYDGLGLELVTAAHDPRQPWTDGRIPAEYAVRGFHTVLLEQANPEATIKLLTEQMQHRLLAETPEAFRFVAGEERPGNYVDVVFRRDGLRGLQGGGTVHHVAFSTDTAASQLDIRETLLTRGLQVTPVLDRNYFQSIYFREPGGVLFEIATNPPGFAVDEPVAQLGSALKLPEWYEPRRADIEQALEPIENKQYD